MGIIQRQSFKNLISAYTGILLGFLSLFIIQPRFLSPQELGLTRLLFSFSYLTATFVPLGINIIINKYFPNFNNPEKRHHGFLGFAMAVTCFGVLLGYTVLFLCKGWILSKYAQESGLFLDYFNLIFPLIFSLAAINTITTYLFVRLKTTVPPFINDVLVRLMIITVVAIYHFRWVDRDVFMYLFTGVYALQLGLLLFYLYSEEKPGWKIDWDYLKQQPLKQMFGFGLLMWTGTMAAVGLKELSTVILGQFMSLEFIAIYAIASFVPTVIEAPMGALEKIAAPKITFAWSKNDMEEISVIYHKSVRNLLLVGGLLFALINTNIVDLLKFLPDQYAQGYIVVWIVSISSLSNMSTGLNNAILLYSNKYRPGALLLIGLVIMNFFLQITLVPRIGIAGAAIATALSQLLFNLFNFLLVWKYFRLQPIDKSALAIFLLIAISVLVGFMVPQFSLPILTIFVRSALVATLYLGTVYYFNLAPDIQAMLVSLKTKWLK